MREVSVTICEFDRLALLEQPVDLDRVGIEVRPIEGRPDEYIALSAPPKRGR
jgi:hypothetical protein